jgi:pimeloyl-ACP methyl ester carboxylesterase
MHAGVAIAKERALENAFEQKGTHPLKEGEGRSCYERKLIDGWRTRVITSGVCVENGSVFLSQRIARNDVLLRCRSRRLMKRCVVNARITPVEERKNTVVFMKSRKPFGAPTPLHDTLKRVFTKSCIRRLGLLFVVGLLIAGCSPSTTSPSTSGNSSARSTRSFARLVDIGGGRKMYLECRGSGSPTVVLVSGLDSAADVWTSYQANPSLTVFSEVSEFTRVCAYDRPGTPVGDNLTPSRSDPVSQPTTTQDAVRDLHALLQAAGEPGPYILVGHSYGGLITRLYAGEYPNNVAGMVFVDAFAPEWQIAKAITGPSKDQLTQYPAIERIDFDASVAQARAAAPLPACRGVVTRHPHQSHGTVHRVPGSERQVACLRSSRLGYTNDRAWNKSQDALARLVPNTQHIVITGSGHNIQIDHPQAVTDAIHEVFDRAR